MNNFVLFVCFWATVTPSQVKMLILLFQTCPHMGGVYGRVASGVKRDRFREKQQKRLAGLRYRKQVEILGSWYRLLKKFKHRSHTCGLLLIVSCLLKSDCCGSFPRRYPKPTHLPAGRGCRHLAWQRKDPPSSITIKILINLINSSARLLMVSNSFHLPEIGSW